MQQARTKEERQELILLYKQSGMSARAFAEELKIKYLSELKDTVLFRSMIFTNGFWKMMRILSNIVAENLKMPI